MKGKYYSRVIKVMIFIINFGLISIAFQIMRGSRVSQSLSNDQATSFFLIFGLIWVVAGFYNKIYQLDTTSLLRNISTRLLTTFLLHFIIISAILLTTNIYIVYPTFLSGLYVLTMFFIVGFRLFYKLVTKYFQFSSFDQRKVVIIGAEGSGAQLYKYFQENDMAGYQFVGFFDESVDTPINLKRKIVGKLNLTAIKDFCIKHDIGEIYYTLTSAHKELLHDIARFADENFIYFRVAGDFSEMIQDNGDVFLMNSVPILTARKEPLGISLNANMKRLFDIVFSLCVIIFLFPILIPIVAFAIRADSPGPIFFKQLRPGKRNKLFDCYKFRTMKVNQTGELQATKNDSRITKVGRFMRKTNIDEIPQFFNVLLGNMSVVGPRPNMISQLEEYSKSIHNYRMRHFVTPGITGYAQVNGFRGETKEVELMEKRVQYDVQYIENWSLALDMKIIFLTLWNMVKGEKNAF